MSKLVNDDKRDESDADKRDSINTVSVDDGSLDDGSIDDVRIEEDVLDPAGESGDDKKGKKVNLHFLCIFTVY